MWVVLWGRRIIADHHQSAIRSLLDLPIDYTSFHPHSRSDTLGGLKAFPLHNILEQQSSSMWLGVNSRWLPSSIRIPIAVLSDHRVPHRFRYHNSLNTFVSSHSLRSNNLVQRERESFLPCSHRRRPSNHIPIDSFDCNHPPNRNHSTCPNVDSLYSSHSNIPMEVLL